MKITLSKPTTCVAIEQELGLNRDDVKEILPFEDGSIEIDFAKDLTTTQKDKLESVLGMKITTQEGK